MGPIMRSSRWASKLPDTTAVTNSKRTRRVIAANIVIAVALLALIDATAFALLPNQLARSIWPYRCTDCVPPPYIGTRTFPQGYFIADSAMGFDISPAVNQEPHWVDGFYYGVWSNKLSCFDSAELPTSDYVYLAGDSFSWGFAPFDSKFGTLIERRLNIRVMKCGVPHTGQAHQLTKARQIIARIGKSPKLIIVQYYPNDICNDFAYPHSTAIDGWLVEDKNIEIDNGTWRVQSQPIEQITDGSKSRVAGPGPATSVDDLMFSLEKYSLSFNVIERFFYRIRSATWGISSRPLQSSVYPKGLCDGSTSPSYNGPIYKRNSDSLRAFKSYADSIGSSLVVVLVPPYSQIASSSYFEKLKDLLVAEGIGHVDLSPPLSIAHSRNIELYWAENLHLNVAGNELAADKIVAYLGPRLFVP
jgi:hypothetical protein